MPQPDWDALSGEMRDLQARVSRLEHRLGIEPAAAVPAPQAQVASTGDLSAPAILPILGRALLGLAGAYLLRALTESTAIPRGAGVAAGLLYAMLWLVWAARTPAHQRLETALHGLTGALVVSPLLFEATARLHIISTWTAAALLSAFAVFGFAISWRKDLLIVATFATLAALGTGGALLLTTHDAVPFTFLFLFVAAAVEMSACLNHWLSERWLTAGAADLAVILLTWLVTNARGVPESYVPIPYSAVVAAQVMLLAAYLSSTIVRTLLRGFTITWFETAQCAAAFLIAVGSSPGPAMAVMSLVCSAACYLVAFRVLDRGAAHGRNFYTYSTFGLLLAITASRTLLSVPAASLAWAALTIAAAALPRLTLQVHGVIFLLLSVAASGALVQAYGVLLGASVWPIADQWAIWLGAVTAVASLLSRDVPGWAAAVLRGVRVGVLVVLASGIAAGLLTYGYHTVFGAAATHAYCATLRTTVIAGAALLIARFGRVAPLIYALMILGAWRLVTVDLYQDQKAALFLSLLLYGATLMLLPKVSRAAIEKQASSL